MITSVRSMRFNSRARLRITDHKASVRAGSKKNPDPGYSVNSFQLLPHFSDFGTIKSKMTEKPDCHCQPSSRGPGQGINRRHQYLKWPANRLGFIVYSKRFSRGRHLLLPLDRSGRFARNIEENRVNARKFDDFTRDSAQHIFRKPCKAGGHTIRGIDWPKNNTLSAMKGDWYQYNRELPHAFHQSMRFHL